MRAKAAELGPSLKEIRRDRKLRDAEATRPEWPRRCWTRWSRATLRDNSRFPVPGTPTTRSPTTPVRSGWAGAPATLRQSAEKAAASRLPAARLSHPLP